MAQIDHHLLMALMDTIPDRIYFKDCQGRFISVNRATREFHRTLNEKEIEGLTDFDFFLPEHANQAFADEQQIITTGKPLVGKLEQEKHPDGRITWVSTTKVPTRDGSGKIIGICGISRDVTEEHLQSEKLKEYTDALAGQQEQMAMELALAREVQQALLPQSYPSFPHDATEAGSALRFSHRYLPEGRVGGDFFTINQISDTQAGVLICDVMGHGVHAALVTAVERVLVEEIQGLAGDPGAFLGELNRRLHHFFGPLSTSMFVTALYLVIDTTTGAVRFANASHPQPLHICRDRHTVRTMGDDSQRHPFALGVAEDSVYPTEQGAVKAGDFLLLYTDGLSDLGEDKDLTPDDPRFLALIQNCARQRGEAFLDALLTQARQFSGQDDFRDDVCLVGIEIERLTGSS
ncbi:MAG TPA: SpoIIE family protein phosphatase [Candidatus Methylacidiphilales bacterium]|jgi:sigma-B regulation protein RsbU (phosphoserine phosphatase)|nr:SpoIIE family protein phosphatase [Candidatus Methylacidiphilales bacterium]